MADAASTRGWALHPLSLAGRTVVMIRLTVLEQTPAQAVLKVEGWVADSAVALLAQEGARLLAVSRCLVLELCGVEFVDAAGLTLLGQWAGPRLHLKDGSPPIRRLLERHGLRCVEVGAADQGPHQA